MSEYSETDWDQARQAWRSSPSAKAWKEWEESEPAIRKRALAQLRCAKGCELAVVWDAAAGRAIWAAWRKHHSQTADGSWMKVSSPRDSRGRIQGTVRSLAELEADNQKSYEVLALECEHMGRNSSSVGTILPELLSIRAHARTLKGILDESGSLTWVNRKAPPGANRGIPPRGR